MKEFDANCFRKIRETVRGMEANAASVKSLASEPKMYSPQEQKAYIIFGKVICNLNMPTIKQ